MWCRLMFLVRFEGVGKVEGDGVRKWYGELCMTYVRPGICKNGVLLFVYVGL